MKKKKWLYVVGIVVIIVPVLYLYISFNSTFISKWKAKQVALDYLNEVYDEGAYWYENTNYTFKDNSYYVRYFAYGPIGEYSATVEVGNGLWPSKVLYTHINDEVISPIDNTVMYHHDAKNISFRYINNSDSSNNIISIFQKMPIDEIVVYIAKVAVV